MGTPNRMTSVLAGTVAVRRIAILAIATGMGTTLVQCRPSDVLSVQPPAGVTPSTVYQNQTGAEALLTNGRAQVFQGVSEAFSGLLQWSGLLSDEFTWTYFAFGASDANIDARQTAAHGGFQELGDPPLQSLLAGRLTLLAALPGLKQYEPAAGRPKAGEAYALIGYVELLLAEDYCAGVPLDMLVAGQGVRYGSPLSSDSLLGVAEADFDSAAAYAAGDASGSSLAAVGLARVRVDRGQFATAGAIVGNVATSFVYNTELQPGGFSSGGPQTFNLYDEEAVGVGCGFVNVGDRKGTNGLNFVSAQDPRLMLNTSVGKTCDGLYTGSADSVWYYPVKFGNPSTYVPLATGVEARLIEAEVALKAGQLAQWAATLRRLRADTADTHVTFPAADSLPADSAELASAQAQIDLLFRERAFWLYGTGTRLGDMRRLIRQYGRDQGAVFPTGLYPNGNNPKLPTPLPNYGTDVSLTLPTSGSGLADPNPAYKGCLTSTKVA